MCAARELCPGKSGCRNLAILIGSSPNRRLGYELYHSPLTYVLKLVLLGSGSPSSLSRCLLIEIGASMALRFWRDREAKERLCHSHTTLTPLTSSCGEYYTTSRLDRARQG